MHWTIIDSRIVANVLIVIVVHLMQYLKEVN